MVWEAVDKHKRIPKQYKCSLCANVTYRQDGRPPTTVCGCESGHLAKTGLHLNYFRDGVASPDGLVICDCGASYQTTHVRYGCVCHSCGKEYLKKPHRNRVAIKIACERNMSKEYYKFGNLWSSLYNSGELCKEWGNFEVFYRDIIQTHERNYLLHKIDPSKKHSKDNSVWKCRRHYTDESVVEKAKTLQTHTYVGIDDTHVHLKCNLCGQTTRRRKFSVQKSSDRYRCIHCVKAKKKEAKVRKNTDKCSLYYIKIGYNGKTYYKVGITTRTVEQRFAGCNLNITTVLFKQISIFV